MAALVAQFQDVFAMEDEELGATHLARHHIDTGDAEPIKQYARRIPHSLRMEVRDLVNDMLDRGIITPSTSLWASPIVLVRKKDGSYRFCVDYRKLNAVTRTEAFPLPRIDDYLDTLAGARYFSTLDLASGFWQVVMGANSVMKTTFATHEGAYQFRVMPFGLKNAPTTFQWLMQQVLAGLPTTVCMSYIDDILVVGKTLGEHLDNLQTVLKRLCKAGLKLKPSKCSLLKREVVYLGFVVSRNGVKADHSKVAAVQDFPRPDTVKKLRSFLGLSSYYRRFIPGYAKIAHPLHELTSTNKEFIWTDDCEEAFKRLKSCLVAAPVLRFPDLGQPYILETDASAKGLGAVLAQCGEDGKIHPIASASHTTQGAERNYGSSELEALAVVWATRHFRHYLDVQF